MTQAEKFMTLINNTPGVVSDRMIEAAGITWPRCVHSRFKLPIVRVSGFGYRKAP